MEFDRNEERAPERHSAKSGEGSPVATGTLPEVAPVTSWADYASVVSRAQGYQLDEAQLARVVAQLELISSVAAPLLALPLPAETEPAPVFRP